MAFGGFGACMGLVVWVGVVCVSRWLTAGVVRLLRFCVLY